MKQFLYLLFIPFFLGNLSLVSAQETSNKFEKGENVRIPSLHKDSLKSQRPIEDIKPKEEEKPKTETSNAGKVDDGSFSVFKEGSIVNTNPLQNAIGELKVVRISEELQVDCVWIKAAEYYAIWDSKYPNPYQKDAALFRDTVQINLYNIAEGELWSAPLETTLQTSVFGPRWGRFHQGIDLNLQMGAPIGSAFDGIIRISGFDRGFGNYVVVRHKNGIETLYGHMSVRKVEVGQLVKAGQIIGLGGSTGWSTGPHLHYETRYEGNPFNPALMYDFSQPDQLLTDKFDLMPHHFSHLGNKIRKTISHKVNPGETLSIIGAKYNVSVTSLAKLNRLEEDTILKVGQTLIIK
jgi:murein DD-endopeptidase MepM/ murein hydrolase activator NlpD